MVARNVPPVPEATLGAHRWWALTAVECGNFVVYMDGFIVTHFYNSLRAVHSATISPPHRSKKEEQEL